MTKQDYKEYQKQWRDSHKESRREYQKNYYQLYVKPFASIREVMDERNVAQNRRRAKNKAAML
jgi:hypothetical protein